MEVTGLADTRSAGRVGRGAAPAARAPRRGLRAVLAALTPKPFDASTLAVLYVLLLFCLPGDLVVSSLGAAGRPAVLLGVALAAVWLVGRLRPAIAPFRPQPISWLMGGWVAVMLLAYATGMTRALTGLEVRGADRSLISLVAAAGVVMWTMDEVRSLHRLETVLRWITYGAAFSGLVALVQFQLGVDLNEHVRLPGLELNSSLTGIRTRGFDVSLRRVSGTAGHPIEFGVLSALALPLAVHFALFAKERLERQVRWGIVLVLAIGIPISISRAAVIGLLVGMGSLVLAWRGPLQQRAVVVGIAFLVFVRVAVPGLVGTIRGLFTYASQDSSIEARTTDYDVVQDLVAARPWFGLGPGTFLPEEHFILDNEYLGTLVSAGALGLLALVSLYLGGYAVARRVRRRPGLTEPTQHLAQSLAAAMLVALASSATFDAFAFPSFAGLFWLLLGTVGALFRITSADVRTGLESDPAGQPRKVLRR